MKMQSTYGIFEDEADPIIQKVLDHATLPEIKATPCPACGANILVAFCQDGTGFTLNCDGKPFHTTPFVQTESPPPWWQQCKEQPTNAKWYWREWHSYDDDGTLRIKTSGWQADDTRWSGVTECPMDHPDYGLWRWILHESDCTDHLISEDDLAALRVRFGHATH